MNGSMCAYPWVHMHVTPLGDVKPCCMLEDDHGENYLNINEVNIMDAMNSEGMKKMRRNMINNASNEVCRLCYNREEMYGSSSRTDINKIYMNDITDEIASTNSDGSLVNFSPRFLDIRFGNICNLKCRTCNHDFSSSWYDEIVGGNPDYPRSKFISNDALEKIIPYIDKVDRIYWAGGEPILMEEHHALLSLIIERGQTDVELIYNTNLSTLSYKRLNMMDVWSNFRHVTIAASIDGMGDEVEYVRTNLHWENFKNNFNIVKESGLSNITIFPSITISVLNILDIVPFLAWCVSNNWINDVSSFDVNYVNQPAHYNINELTTDIKHDVQQVIDDQLNLHPNVYPVIKRITDYMFSKHGDIDASVLSRVLDGNDVTANLDWKTALPSLHKILC